MGSHLGVGHLAPTPEGRAVTARAELVAVESRKLTFRVVADDAAGRVGEGSHERFIIDVERFLLKADAR